MTLEKGLWSIYHIGVLTNLVQTFLISQFRSGKSTSTAFKPAISTRNLQAEGPDTQHLRFLVPSPLQVLGPFG